MTRRTPFSRVAAPALVAMLALVASSLVAPSLRAADGPETVPLEGVPAAVTAPAGTWTRTPAKPVPGQWMLYFSAPDGTAACEARVFPVKDQRDPTKVLLQAVDLVVRGTGGEGMGIGSIDPLDLAGRPAAETAVTAVFGGSRWRGSARLLLAADGAWAFAWGLAAEDAPDARRQAALTFSRTLVPTGPAFHEPRFRFQGLDEVVVEVPGEEPIRTRHLLAADLLVEVARGHRFSLSARARLREDVAAAARGASPRSSELRRRLREATAAVLEAEELTDVMRRSAYGLHAASFVKHLDAHEALRHRRPVSSPGKDEERAADARASLLEWSAFLASIAADAPVAPGPEGALPEPASPEEATARLEIGAEWAAARRAWDEADTDRRFRFRRAVLDSLASGEAERGTIAAIPDAKALRAFLDRRGPPDPSALLRSAARLPAGERRRLLEVLGAGDGSVRFGW